MSPSQLPKWRACPGIWLWSMAFILPPALAAIAASHPLQAPSGDAVWVNEAAAGESAAPEGPTVREARRVLIDIPGQDPLSTLVEDLLYFDAEPAAQPAEAERTGQLAPVVISPAVSPAIRISAEAEAEIPLLIIPALGAPPEMDVPAAKTARAEPKQETSPVPAASESTAAEPRSADEPTPESQRPAKATTTRVFTPEQAELRDKIRKVLAMHYPRHLSARDNTPWEVMHAIIAYGVDTRIFKDRPGGETVNAIGWLCYNYPCAGQPLLFINAGKVDASRGVGVQGHAGQFLAMLAQSRVMGDYPMLVNGKQFTLAELIEREKETCVAGEELTFKLISLMHYLDSDETWTTRDGQQWSIPRLIHEELKAPIRGAACGGTHRLMGYSYAVNKQLARGKPIEGEFRRAQIYTQDYHRYTFSLQNSDGSFSTAWFERRASDPSIDRRIKTTGHILEWITFSLPEDELDDPRVVKATDYLATLLLANNGHTWEIGPLGHALHALSLYDERVFKDNLPAETAPLAEQAKGTSAR